MTDQTPSALGTVAQEAARLIEDMATFARSSRPSDEPRPYDGGPDQDVAGPPPPPPAGGSPEATAARGSADESTMGACSECGRDRDTATETAEIPASCKLCPLCRGIALLRSVRPETVDLLADLALAMAASLRDVATRSRASDPGSTSRTASGRPAEGDRVKVQDIPVDDESEG